MVAVIVEDFGARAARTSVTHLPVVGCVWRTFVIADANNTSRGIPTSFPRFRRLRRRFHRR